MRYAFCGKSKACGHDCKGVEGETECFPCLNAVCSEQRNNPQAEAMEPQDLMRMQSEGA